MIVASLTTAAQKHARASISQLSTLTVSIFHAEAPNDLKPWFWSDKCGAELQNVGLKRGYNWIVLCSGACGVTVSHWRHAAAAAQVCSDSALSNTAKQLNRHFNDTPCCRERVASEIGDTSCAVEMCGTVPTATDTDVCQRAVQAAVSKETFPARRKTAFGSGHYCATAVPYVPLNSPLVQSAMRS